MKIVLDTIKDTEKPVRKHSSSRFQIAKTFLNWVFIASY